MKVEVNTVGIDDIVLSYKGKSLRQFIFCRKQVPIKEFTLLHVGHS